MARASPAASRSFSTTSSNNGGWPRQVDKSAFTLGEDLAATPGKVVFRNDLIELIQYAPQTETVFETPLLLSPPWINKYYVMDLAPGRASSNGRSRTGTPCFAISYRNPDESMRDLGLEDYLRKGPLSALEVIGEITGCRAGEHRGALPRWHAHGCPARLPRAART